jgi:nitroimidazol reductase NimA-like FMN-containing flavoprotein (pyridoxamine 5'-phosphate oxidase superfamily)
MTPAETNVPPSLRTRVRRVAHRGQYDRVTLHALLDEAYVCHIAFSDEHGVHCIPTACWREGDYLYIHGSNGSRMLKLAASGAQVCVTVNHSMNYRSAVIYGSFEAVSDDHKAAALDVFLEGITPGRSQEVRAGNAKELAATTMLRISLAEAACKTRTGGPKDDEEDMDLAVWAGVLPMALSPLAPIVDEAAADIETPGYVREWRDGSAG